MEDNLAQAFCLVGELQAAIDHCKASIQVSLLCSMEQNYSLYSYMNRSSAHLLVPDIQLHLISNLVLEEHCSHCLHLGEDTLFTIISIERVLSYASDNRLLSEC